MEDFCFSNEVPCGGLIRPTVATELFVFSELFRTICGHFNLSLDFSLMARPHLRIFRRISCIRMGWSGSIAARVTEGPFSLHILLASPIL